MIKNLLLGYIASFVFVFGFASSGPAQKSSSTEFPTIKIENFGKMDDRFYRGAQPLPEDFPALQALGVNTVIDLRNDPTDYEKAAVEAVGMRYINIPMSGWKTPKDSQLEQFLKIANDPATGVFFVHCKAGKHRTGVAGAVYRFKNYGWNYNQVFAEMKEFNFTWWPVHLQLQSYVKDYAERIEDEKAKARTTPAQILQGSN